MIFVASNAGLTGYAYTSAYCASKHALKAVNDTLRLEMIGKPVRVTSIDPGMVDTEFSLVRFSGDAEKAKSVYQGMTPLSAQDIADCIVFAATRPAHMNIDRIMVNPTDQAELKIHRR
jgi:NADP-dependent 3-hydroxy acid dehydrogenase YdfG